MIVRKGKLIERVRPSADFGVKVLYATPQFINLCTPQSNYGTKGSIALFLNPVMRLTDEQRFVCERDFRWIEYRLGQTDHNFYDELLRNAVQAAILDFFDFHSKLFGESSISTQNAAIMYKFLSMLENGSYRHNREVKFYADAICVTPKYLSEVSKKGQWLCSQLLDKPLYHSRHLTPSARQIAVVRPDFRYVRLLIASLLQPLRPELPRRQPLGIPRVRTSSLD